MEKLTQKERERDPRRNAHNEERKDERRIPSKRTVDGSTGKKCEIKPGRRTGRHKKDEGRIT